MIKLNRRSFVAGAAAAASLPMLASRATAADPLKVGYIYVGPINDGGWNTAHEAGRQAMLKQFGDKVDSQYVKNVAEGPDAERVLRDLYNQNNQQHKTTTNNNKNTAKKEAQAFPD